MRLDANDPILKKTNKKTGESYFDTYMKEVLGSSKSQVHEAHYGRVQIIEDCGIKWRSNWERLCYLELKKLEILKVISDLESQVSFVFEHNEVRIGKFIADFRFKKDGKIYVADSKSWQTKRHERVKWQLNCMKAFYGIEVIVFMQRESDVESVVLGLK